MTATVGHFANLPSHGCFVYFEKPLAGLPAVVAALIAAMIDELSLDDVQISTKPGKLQWSRFAPKKVEAALAGASRDLTFLVGAPSDVHLGARIDLRGLAGYDPRMLAPPQAWLAAEATRWPAERFAAVARAWFRIVAEHGAPLSGGAFASDNMRNAKVEASREYESFEGEATDARFEHLTKEPGGVYAWEKLRRFYPITLLGPKLAAKTSPDALREAGAGVEAIGDSLLVDVTSLVETWSKPYLEATAKLRALAWPWMFQHPLDKPRR